MSKPLIELEHLSRRFQVKRNVFITAVSDVSLTIHEGEIVCLVGESGLRQNHHRQNDSRAAQTKQRAHSV